FQVVGHLSLPVVIEGACCNSIAAALAADAKCQRRGHLRTAQRRLNLHHRITATRGQAMRIGIHLPHIGRKAGPEAIRRAAIQAEELGFADAWSSEHIIIPKGAPYPPSAIFYDPVLTLTWAAAFTKKIGLGTSVLVLAMRHPLPVAKELATLQNLSEGRLILGAGVGWMAAEFAALGVPFRERGRRMDEGIAMMQAVWGEDPVSFPARHIPAIIEEMRMLPQPVEPIPIWIGGSSEPELARAVPFAGGWHGPRLAPRTAAPTRVRPG